MLSVFEIGEKIAVARKMKNFSQARLAELLSVSAQAVGKWERGESMPDIITFGRISEVLGVDLNYFANTQEHPIDFSGTASSAELEKSNQKLGWNMSGSNWVDADFSGLCGLAEKFNGANIKKCQFVESELTGLMLKGNNIDGSDFTNSNLSQCIFSSSNFESNVFADCDFSKSEFSRSNIKNCNFSGTDLTDVVSKWCNFQNVKLSGATLLRTTFQWGSLTGLTFEGDITDCSFINCDFSRVEYNGAVILNTFFKNCKLKHVKFINCKTDKLSYAFMKTCKADLSGVEIMA